MRCQGLSGEKKAACCAGPWRQHEQQRRPNWAGKPATPSLAKPVVWLASTHGQVRRAGRGGPGPLQGLSQAVSWGGNPFHGTCRTPGRIGRRHRAAGSHAARVHAARRQHAGGRLESCSLSSVITPSAARTREGWAPWRRPCRCAAGRSCGRAGRVSLPNAQHRSLCWARREAQPSWSAVGGGCTGSRHSALPPTRLRLASYRPARSLAALVSSAGVSAPGRLSVPAPAPSVLQRPVGHQEEERRQVPHPRQEGGGRRRGFQEARQVLRRW